MTSCVGHARRLDRLRNHGGDRHSIADRELSQRNPAVDGHERMIAVASTSRPDASRTRKTSLRPLEEHVRHRARDHAHALVERPHQRSLARAQQFTERHLRTVVGAQDPGGRREASRLTKVRNHRRLSVRCSGPRFSWLIATTGTSSSLASSLMLRENSETSCWRDSTFLPDVISCM